MPTEAWATLAAIIVSLILQVLKDHIKVSPNLFPLVAAIAGAIASTATTIGANGGSVDATATATAAPIGALSAVGTHGLLLARGAWLGRVLKAIGAATWKTGPT